MASGNKAFLHQGVSSVLQLCDMYRILNDMRVDLDSRITTLPMGDQAQNVLWQELEATLIQLSDLTAQLAALRSAHPGDLRAKAIVLALRLRAHESDLRGLDSETVALALSLADEVAA